MRTVCLKNFDFASRTHKGLVRKRNEDFLAYFDTINGHVFVLCDGMGGHNAGDVAAELATEAVGRYFNNKYHNNPFEAVEEAIIFANKEVVMHALGNDYLYGMGTTIVLVLIRDDRVFYGHAGDSRLYVYKNKKLQQLTTDHSHIQSLLDKGLISKKEAENHPRRNEITRAVGLSYDFEPEVSSKAFIPENEDILILCSDGLSNMIRDQEMIAILDSKYKINDKANKLIKKANSRGGLDNISVQIIKFHNLLGNENSEDIYIKPKQFLNFKKIGFVIVSIIIILLSFFVGLYESGVKEISNQYLNSRAKQTETSEILAYVPLENDTWETIAYKFNTDTKTLQALNPNVEKINDIIHIKIPVRTSIVVKQATDIELFAMQYSISTIDIMKANDINNIYLTIGSKIIIPLKGNSKSL